jgi:hypothetical protein
MFPVEEDESLVSNGLTDQSLMDSHNYQQCLTTTSYMRSKSYDYVASNSQVNILRTACSEENLPSYDEIISRQKN